MKDWFIRKWSGAKLRARDLKAKTLGYPLQEIPELSFLRPGFGYGVEDLNCLEVAKHLALTIQSAEPGDVAEFGTQSGRTARVLGAAMRTFGHKGRLWLFDSFQGMPDSSASPVDRHAPETRPDGPWAKGKLTGLSAAELRRQIPTAQVVEGWFQDTLPKIPHDVRFSVVHLDCDLYESTLTVLRHLPLAPRAVLLFDDWGRDPSRGQPRAYTDFVLQDGSFVATSFRRYAAFGMEMHVP